jgi:hypothetical protein
MWCPLCCEEHDVEIIDREANVELNGQQIKYAETVYICDKDEENCFIPEEAMKKNFEAAKAALKGRER